MAHGQYVSEAERQQARLNAERALREFFQCVPQGSSKNEKDTYKGDTIALRNHVLPPAKRLPDQLLSENYFHHYLQHLASPDSHATTAAFLSAKLESARYTQWSGRSLLNSGAPARQLTSVLKVLSVNFECHKNQSINAPVFMRAGNLVVFAQ
jgi:hypothetical protein